MATTYPNYPTYADVVNFLTAWPVLKVSTLSTAQQVMVNNLIAARIQMWERLSGYTPFLCAQNSSGIPIDTERVFDPPGNANAPVNRGGYWWWGSQSAGRSNRLYIECGFTSITTIYIDVTYQYNPGNLLVYGQDYLLKPNNAIVEGKPYNEVEFVWDMLGGISQSIHITGKFGYGTAVPADAWQAIVEGTAADMVPSIAMYQLGDAIELQEKDEKIVARQGKGQSAYTQLADTWKQNFTRTLKQGGYVRQPLV